MVAQGEKPTGVASTVKALRFLIVVSSVAIFLLPGDAQLRFAQASTSGVCVTEGQACFQDETCTACILTIGTTGASVSVCAEQYTLDSETGDDTCDLFGVAYCCAAELSELACLTDETTLVYWSCVLDNSGCTLDDMPCLEGTVRTVDKCTIHVVGFLVLAFVADVSTP